MRKGIPFAALALLSLALSACATTQASPTEPVPLVEGPPVQYVASPYQDALSCVANNLTPEQRNAAFGVGVLTDSTGRISVASDGAFGSFSTQGGSDMLISSLYSGGVRVIETSPAYRQLIDWFLLKGTNGLVGDGQMRTLFDPETQLEREVRDIPIVRGTLRQPEYLVIGSITAMDFIPGEGFEVNVAGIGAGYRQYRIQVRLDLRVVRMPLGTTVGGEVVALVRTTKQIVADETRGQVARFFGNRESSSLVEFNIGRQRREALQYAEGLMIDWAAADLLMQTFDVPTCRPYLELASRT